MKSALFAAAGFAACLALAGVSALQAASPVAAATDPTTVADGRRVDNFELTDHTRMAYQLYYYKYAPAIVLMTRTNGTAYSRATSAELQKLAAAYADKGVLFFMLDSNLGDTRDAVAAEAAKQGLTIPIMMDENQLVGEQLGVRREGEVFVIDPKTWRAAYHGPLDNRFAQASPDLQAPAADAYAAKAIDAVLAGKPAATPQVELAVGKAVAFPARAHAAAFAEISYSRDVAPILQEKCVACHINGGIGPFAMDSYRVIKGEAPMIRETLRTRRMPPYFADPHIGAFKHDQSLSPDEVKTLVHWVEAGAPRGAGADPLLANAGKTAPAWPTSLGQPDVVVNLPAFNVPATGVIEYQNMRVDNPFTQNTWLRAIAMKPGDRSVLHHVVSNYVPDRSAPPATIPGGSVGSYTPGSEPQVMADNSGAPVPAGGKLNFQMHYTTTGRATTDQTQVGFYVLKTPPKYIKRSAVIGGFNLYIPAGEARHKEIAYLTFPADAYLYTLFPHAHYRGMHVELMELTPEGKQTMLLSLPKYDFNWQRDYDPVKPILIKAGTRLVATWVYDNSVHNPANPDPKRNVTWGEQTPDEMMYFRVNYRWADETVAHPRGDLQARLMSSMMLGGLDTNLDGKLERSELHGPMGSRLLARFDDLDKDHDGTLDASELAGMSLGSRRALASTPNL
jgi:mono/diheme cytochrome c family protein